MDDFRSHTIKEIRRRGVKCPCCDPKLARNGRDFAVERSATFAGMIELSLRAC